MYIAKVNGYKIKPKEFKAELYQLKKDSDKKMVTKRQKLAAVNNLIDGYLLLQQAKQRHYEVDDQQIQSQFRKLQSRYESQEEFKKDLKKFSITPDKVLHHIRNQFIIKQFIQDNFKDQVNIETEMLLNYYKKHKDNFKKPEEVHLYHCLLRKDDPQVDEKVSNIKDKLSDGADFCKIVNQYSVCPSNKNNGDLGYVQRGKFIDELEEVIFNLKKGSHAGPIKTEFGYHFVKVVDKKPASTPKFEEIKDSLKKHLERITSELELLKFIRKCRKEAKIEIQEENL